MRAFSSTSGLLLLLIGVLGLSLFLQPNGAWDRAIDWLFSPGPAASAPAPSSTPARAATADRRTGSQVA